MDDRARGREERFEIDESVATWKSWGSRATPRMCIKDPTTPIYRVLTPEPPLHARRFVAHDGAPE